MLNDAMKIKEADLLQNTINQAWDIIAPCWPLKNIIAVNPLKGLENLNFEEAIESGSYFFQKNKLSDEMSVVNRETIKWCQAYFDDGQSTIQMPLRESGFYAAFRKLIIFDRKIPVSKKDFIAQLPSDSMETIYSCMQKLEIAPYNSDLFIKNLLTTLPGWASYIKYQSKWSLSNEETHRIEQDYLAIRLTLAALFLNKTDELLEPRKNDVQKTLIQTIEKSERQHHHSLIDEIYTSYLTNKTLFSKKPKAQFVFCIDVRSEPFRKAIESVDNYETFGFAGFFGLPICIESPELKKYASCPVLLKPLNTVEEHFQFDSINAFKKNISKESKIKLSKQLYQSLKYNFTTPFLLAEFLGFWSGLWMTAKTLFPKKANHIKTKIKPTIKKSPCVNELGILEGIPFLAQVDYAEGMLRAIDLVNNFAPVILLCGHGSSTTNNTYATSLDCGACGGHDGAANARIMATILNTDSIRSELNKRGIQIPTDSRFIAALHNTTTDNLTLFTSENYSELSENIKNASLKNSQNRLQHLLSKKDVSQLSMDWAETRPEWGLAKNAAFIVAQRNITRSLDLKGRCFLHSYNWETDKDLKIITTILTAPMIVAQWINCQYLFSTLDPIAYGSGSKVTQNITGKIGVMQGNASDLMHGLPIQSTHQSDHLAYHEPIRLMTIVYAPKDAILKVISENNLLKNLTKNAWVKFCCIDPRDKKVNLLTTDFTWINHEPIQ